MKYFVLLMALLTVPMTSSQTQLPVRVGTTMTYQFTDMQPSGLTFFGVDIALGDTFTVSLDTDTVSDDVVTLDILINGVSKSYDNNMTSLISGPYLIYPQWTSLESYADSSNIYYEDQGDAILFYFFVTDGTYDYWFYYLYSKDGYLQAEREEYYTTGTKTNPLLQVEYDLTTIDIPSLLSELSIEQGAAPVLSDSSYTYRVNGFQTDSWNGLSNLGDQFTVGVKTAPKSSGNIVLQVQTGAATQYVVQNINQLGSFVISTDWIKWGFRLSDLVQAAGENEFLSFTINDQGFTVSYQNIEGDNSETLDVVYTTEGILQSYRYFRVEGNNVTAIDIALIPPAKSSVNPLVIGMVAVVLSAIGVAAYIYRIQLKAWSKARYDRLKSFRQKRTEPSEP